MNIVTKEFNISEDGYPAICDTRFVITDTNNNIIDDAQGYGYKTKQTAEKALWYKFKGGREKIKRKEHQIKLAIRNHNKTNHCEMEGCVKKATTIFGGKYFCDDCESQVWLWEMKGCK